MIRHLFKLIWNKKKSNLLITLEVLFSFLVLFAVVTMGVVALERFNQPLGYSYNNVWLVEVDTRLTFDSVYNAQKRAIVDQLLLAMKQLPEIEQTSTWAIPPYSSYMSSYGEETNGKLVRIAIHHGSEDAKDVLGLQLLKGRWFEAADRSVNWKPVVINRLLAEQRFGNEDPLGKNPFPPGSDKPETRRNQDYRVVGVISDFRKGGEFTESMLTSIEYLPIEKTTQAISSNFLIKVRPGTTAEFKERLDRALTAVAKGWSFDIKTLEEMRQADFKPRIAFMITTGLISGFLLLMVALGLTGVLWQNVSRRTQEIGLRRALGSSERRIYQQILGELLVLTTFGLLVGTAIIIQFPLLDIITFVTSKAYIISFLISITFMYGITTVCGLYPSLLAVEVQPAEALHYE
ncbi:MAG TPA: FtsX-like permease family protein [Bacteroidota bacterium]|jgi:putative ABC transport system permease protein|nr:FtsX-like permease family protein [Bacteroidota bacterium]